MQGASMIAQNQASKRAQGAAGQAADLALATSQHNAAIDISQAKQLDLDTVQNIRTERAQDAVYMSRQASSYASAGVLSSGSPLAAQATTAGRLEQGIQQAYVSSQQKQQQMYAAAKVGQLYGSAQAQAYRTEGDVLRTQNFANQLQGGAHLLSTAAGAYRGGAFNFGGGGTPFVPTDAGGS